MIFIIFITSNEPKKVQDGMMYITSSISNLELALLGLNLYKVEKNES